MREYLALAALRLQAQSSFCRPTQSLPASVTLDSPALDVMTDFRQITAVTVAPHATMAEANHRMIEHGVRSLLVIDASSTVLGIITAADILGEKPLRLMQGMNLPRAEISAADLMTAQQDLDVLAFDGLLSAKVGHVVSTLKTWGRQHALAVENDGDGRHLVRGLFSATQIARSLGVPFDMTEVARTFAEIEAILR